jgi:saccharopine dehydrogenase-like NADP-dependent oxidoreductase
LARALNADHAALDIAKPDDLAALLARSPHVVINTVGPFQTADYRVPEACIAAGAHYIDLADSHRFVLGIAQLDEAARARGVAVISGASTVPALSGAVVAESGLAPSSIRIGISPGNRAPRGASLVEAVLGQAGKPIPVLRAGSWTTVPGWGEVQRRRIRIDRDQSLGKRWLSACDAPDLVLLPRLYPSLKSVEFYAGLELTLLHLGLWLL